MVLAGPLQALLACGRLDGISSLLPDPELFLYAYVRREALLSSQNDRADADRGRRAPAA